MRYSKFFFSRLLIRLLILSILWSGYTGLFAATAAPPAQTAIVSVSPVLLTSWEPQVDIVGTTHAVNGVDVATEANGIIKTINFTSGQIVKTGDLLVTLRNDDLRAAVMNDQAQLDLSKTNYQRYLELLKVGLISSRDAQLANYRTQVAQDQAKLLQDQTYLNQTIIRAPFSGKLGLRQVDLGQYISAGNTVVSLQQLTPLYIDFNIPQSNFLQIDVGNKIEIHSSLYPSQSFAGLVVATGSALDTNTRTLPVRAAISNQNQEFLPGMYVHVTIFSGESHQVLTIPETAVVYNSYGNSVYVIKEGKAHLQVIETGKSNGTRVVVKQGLQAGDEVVVAGQNKLYDGQPVKIDNSIQQSAVLTSSDVY